MTDADGREQRKDAAEVPTLEEAALLREKLNELMSELHRLEDNYGKLQSLDDEPKSK